MNVRSLFSFVNAPSNTHCVPPSTPSQRAERNSDARTRQPVDKNTFAFIKKQCVIDLALPAHKVMAKLPSLQQEPSERDAAPLGHTPDSATRVRTQMRRWAQTGASAVIVGVTTLLAGLPYALAHGLYCAFYTSRPTTATESHGSAQAIPANAKYPDASAIHLGAVLTPASRSEPKPSMKPVDQHASEKCVTPRTAPELRVLNFLRQPANLFLSPWTKIIQLGSEATPPPSTPLTVARKSLSALDYYRRGLSKPKPSMSPVKQHATKKDVTRRTTPEFGMLQFLRQPANLFLAPWTKVMQLGSEATPQPSTPSTVVRKSLSAMDFYRRGFRLPFRYFLQLLLPNLRFFRQGRSPVLMGTAAMFLPHPKRR